MNALALTRCLQHPEREASARCVECHQSFCRECITEYGERLLCPACLGRLTRPVERAPSRWAGRLGRVLAAGLGAGVTWGVFYFLGSVLVRIPSTFHAAHLWESSVFR